MLPYAIGINLKRLRHSVWTPRSSVGTPCSGMHRGVVTAIGAEDSGALAMVCGPYLLADHPNPDLNLQRSRRAFGGWLHSRRSLISDESTWAKRAEAVALVVVVKTLAAGMVSGVVGELERSSPGPRAWSLQLEGCEAGKARPLGQGSGSARPGEDRARPGACAAGMVSRVKAGSVHSRLEDGSSVLCLGAYRRLKPTLGWAGKNDSWCRVAPTGERLMMVIIDTGPCAVGVSVVAVIDKSIRPWSRVRGLGCRLAVGRGVLGFAEGLTGKFSVVPLCSEGFCDVHMGAPSD